MIFSGLGRLSSRSSSTCAAIALFRLQAVDRILKTSWWPIARFLFAATRNAGSNGPEPQHPDGASRLLADPGRLVDQTRAALPCEICPNPLALDADPVLQLRQKEQMNKGPREPGCEPR